MPLILARADQMPGWKLQGASGQTAPHLNIILFLYAIVYSQS
jgi:hypothetical protein